MAYGSCFRFFSVSERQIPLRVTSMNDSMKKYFEGRKLYGDDFSLAEIENWYISESEGYHEIYEVDYDRPTYGYHLFNRVFGYDYLPLNEIDNVLGFGSGNGEELTPILKKCRSITIIDPTEQYKNSVIDKVEIRYQKPQISGKLNFETNTFDLIVCFSALHHVPNVSYVMGEFYRCLKPGGYLIVREPVVSMGDWRKPRKRLTKNERGIPEKIFDNIISEVGFEVVSRKYVIFSMLPKVASFFNVKTPYNKKLFVIVDKLFSSLTKFNNVYHPTRFCHKIRPVALSFVLRK